MFARKPDSKKKQALRAAAVSRGLLARALIFGLVAIAGAVWALVRHYTVVPPPMLVPVPPRTAPTFDADAGEVPAPELEPAPKGR